MIIHLKEEVKPVEVERLAAELEAIVVAANGRTVLVTPAALKTLDSEQEALADHVFVSETDMQLADRRYRPDTRSISVGALRIGGDSDVTLMMAGPCSVESREQIEACAELVTDLGVTTLRAGCFKPRTSPYSFQGLGREGLDLLAEMRDRHGLLIITEVRDATHVDDVIEVADIVQIGAKSMYDHGILRRCGTAGKPVLLKRGLATTLQEFVQAAEFILSGGNEDVILCERGIRTFEPKTRFTLDLCGVAYLKHHTNLPIVVDPTHAMGYAYGVPDLARAAAAMGIDGLLIETHPDPPNALSDASQQLGFDQFRELFASLGPIAAAIGRRIA